MFKNTNILMEKSQKVKLNKEFIRNNPNLSGSECYKQIRERGYGIRKTDFYSIFREIRQLPEPTKEKKEKAIPIRYRKPEVKPEPSRIIRKVPVPKKKGEYGIFEIVNKKTKKSYWIKYKSEKNFKRQFDKIRTSDSEGFALSNVRMYFRGFGMYQEFIDKKFMELAKISL